MFHVGQRIVCINANGKFYLHKPLVTKSIYTVRDWGDDGDPRGPWVRLIEISNPIVKGILWDGRFITREPTYSARRFRPIQERKTDISIFKAMLNPERVEA